MTQQDMMQAIQTALNALDRNQDQDLPLACLKQTHAGPGARVRVLDWERANARRLRGSGHLTDPSKHRRP